MPALGGAIALTMHGFARATRDVAINVFTTPEQLPAVLDVLGSTGLTFERATVVGEAAAEGWFTAWHGAVRVDVFVPSIDFSWEAYRSRVKRAFLGEQLWFLSAEALCVFKLLFFRTKDLADLERLVLTSRELEHSVVRATIARLMGRSLASRAARSATSDWRSSRPERPTWRCGSTHSSAQR
ncbi:MAG: hypothetical protein JNG84_08485 [Archangium sp.]|nr:hypothetical protein [Archangium sp.]